MTIGPFLDGLAFDPETTAVLASAFDTAWERLVRSGTPMGTEADRHAIREHLARQIIAAAEDGERDPHRLVERALSYVALHLKTSPPPGRGGLPP
jgi:hypothetical protein